MGDWCASVGLDDDFDDAGFGFMHGVTPDLTAELKW